MSDIKELAAAAKEASFLTATLDSDLKNSALSNIIDSLERSRDEIFKANEKDLSAAEADNLEAPLLKRLRFDEHKLSDCIDGICFP